MNPTTYIRETVIGYRSNGQDVPRLLGPGDVAAFWRDTIEDHAREHLGAIFVNARMRPIAYSVVSIGTATASLVHPREVFQPAVIAGASALFLAHNHPSGDVEPSSQDWDVSCRIAEAGRILGIGLLDHVVWTHDSFSYVSMREHGAPLRTVRWGSEGSPIL